MITKIISTADIHIPSLKKINEVKKVLETFINQCKEIVSVEGKDNVRIVVAGDIFDSKLNITNESVLAVHWFLKELNDICKTIVCAGNHDFLINNTDRIDSLTPIFVIGDLPNVVYLDKELDYKSGCYEDDNVVWCLYSSFDGFNVPPITMEKTKFNELGENKTYVGIVHTDINGAITCTNYVTENGLDTNIFEQCDFVIAGHIHKRQELKKNGVKIVYCSSVRQKDFGENVSGHGFVLWDISNADDISYEYKDVPNEDGGYYKFEIYDIKDIEDDFEELINL